MTTKANHLVLVPQHRSKRPDPKPPRCMRATLWFTAAEWLMLMQLVGTKSLGSWLRKVHGLDGAEQFFDGRSISALYRRMKVPPQLASAHAPARRRAVV